jgi:hypothetical protein
MKSTPLKKALKRNNSMDTLNTLIEELEELPTHWKHEIFSLINSEELNEPYINEHEIIVQHLSRCMFNLLIIKHNY